MNSIGSQFEEQFPLNSIDLMRANIGSYLSMVENIEKIDEKNSLYKRYKSQFLEIYKDLVDKIGEKQALQEVTKLSEEISLSNSTYSKRDREKIRRIMMEWIIDFTISQGID